MREKPAIPREELMARLELPETKAALAKLAKRYRLRFIVLFGSYATDRVTPMSDIDIAVLPGKGGPKDVWRMWVDLVKILKRDRIDIVDLRSAPPLLSYEIALKGTVLCQSDGEVWSLARNRYIKQFDDCYRFESLRLAKLDRSLRRWGVA